MKCQLCGIGEIDNSVAGVVIVCPNCGLKHEIVPMTDEDKKFFVLKALGWAGLIDVEDNELISMEEE